MRNKEVFLLDEISLADDSVIERLNNVPSRIIVLAEKEGEDSENAVIKAEESSKPVVTMNPGGDYGKEGTIARSVESFFGDLGPAGGR